jgi:hypothetical protein
MSVFIRKWNPYEGEGTTGEGEASMALGENSRIFIGTMVSMAQALDLQFVARGAMSSEKSGFALWTNTGGSPMPALPMG